MQYKQLKYFTEIVKAGSFNAAAEKLYVSQPSLSQSIKRFEQELGFALLIRRANGVELTKMGRLVYADAEKLIADAEDRRQKWREAYSTEISSKTRVDLVAQPSSYQFVKRFALDTVQREYPKLKCRLSEAKRFDILNYVNQGRAELGIGNFVDSEKDDLILLAQRRGIEITPLAEDTIKLAISKSEPLSEKPCLDIKDFENLILGLYSGRDGIGSPYFMRYFSEDRSVYVNSFEKLLQMAAEGSAVAVFPERMTKRTLESIGEQRIVFADVPKVRLNITHYLAVPKNELSPHVEYVADKIRKAFAEL